jgi:hypothetical protein
MRSHAEAWERGEMLVYLHSGADNPSSQIPIFHNQAIQSSFLIMVQDDAVNANFKGIVKYHDGEKEAFDLHAIPFVPLSILFRYDSFLSPCLPAAAH